MGLLTARGATDPRPPGAQASPTPASRERPTTMGRPRERPTPALAAHDRHCHTRSSSIRESVQIDDIDSTCISRWGARAPTGPERPQLTKPTWESPKPPTGVRAAVGHVPLRVILVWCPPKARSGTFDEISPGRSGSAAAPRARRELRGEVCVDPSRLRSNGSSQLSRVPRESQLWVRGFVALRPRDRALTSDHHCLNVQDTARAAGLPGERSAVAALIRGDP